MASTFNLLTAGGARFDKSRFKRDFELFNPASSSKSGKKSRKGKEKEVPGGASGVLPANLDFFGDHSHATKAKPATEEDEDEDTVGEEDDELEENEERVEPPKQKITLSGVEPLPSSLHPNLPSLTTHENTALSSSAGKPLLKALSGANIHSLWGVQCAVGGSVLSGRDTMCIAPTGSGKTLSYLLPTIVRLQDPSKVIRRRATGADDSDEEAEQRDVDGEKDDARGIRSIVLVPTYDLAIQIRAVLKAVTRGRAWRAMVLTKATERAICASAPGSKYNSWASTSEGAAGGDSEEDEEDEDESGDEDASDAESTGSVNEFAQDSAQAEGDTESEADDDVEDSAALGLDFLIATPERLHHLLERKLVSLSRTRHIILDESDRLLSKDFRPQVEPILAAVSSTVQKTFLSATMPAGSEEIAKKWLRDGGVRVVVGVKDSAVSTVAQSLLYTGSESGKSLALRNMITSGELPYPSLIFVQSIARAEDLYKTLVLDGVRAEVVHGSKAKSKRDEAIAKFRRGEVWMLVVTEVLARGMDFRGVKVVVNYDFPQTTQSYIHRIGRTGRAGRPGRAITFFSNEDAPHLRTIANVLQASGCFVPPYMLDMPKPSKNQKKERAKAPVKRKDIGGAGRDVALEQSKKKRDMIKASQKRKGRE